MDIQPCSGIFRHHMHMPNHIQTYSELCAWPLHVKPCQNSDIFRTLTHLECKASSKACWTSKMIRHIQSPGIVRIVYFRHFQGYLRDIKEETSPFLFLKSKNVFLWVLFSSLFLAKCSFKCPSSMKHPLPWKISGCTLALRQYLFCEALHLKCLILFWICLSQ